jgi:radical SAM protein with 4Fe4S-binding SPASM domain
VDCVIKPTYRCNLRCLYCCVHDTDPATWQNDLSLDKARQILEAVAQRSLTGNAQVRWHGGEPLCMGLEYFRRIFEFQKRLPVRFDNVVFTNLTLLDDAFLHLFQQYRVILYTSLDAVDPRHDSQRGGHSATVLKRLDALEAAGYADVTVKTTVTSANVSNLPKMYLYLRDRPFEWNFAPVFPAGKGRDHCLTTLPDAQIFSEVAIGIFNDWLSSNKPRVYLFRKVIEELLTSRRPDEVERPMFNVDSQGDIFRCLQFQGHPDYRVASFAGATSIDAFAEQTCEWGSFSFTPCRSCDFSWICKLNHCSYLGDCMKNLHQTFVEQYCATMKPLFQYIQTALHVELSSVGLSSD